MVVGIVCWRARTGPSAIFGLSAHRTAGAWLPNSTNSGGDCPAHSSTGSAFPSWGSSRLWDSGEQGLGETPVGKSWWIVGRTRLNPFPVLQQGTGLGTNTSLAQMVSGLVGQLLMQPVLVGESCSSLAQTLCVASCSCEYCEFKDILDRRLSISKLAWATE